jgi:hypothetical protein
MTCLRKASKVEVNKRAKFEETGVSGMDLGLGDEEEESPGLTEHAHSGVGADVISQHLLPR